MAHPGEVLPQGLAVVGELLAAQDVTIHGRFEGQINVPEHHLSIATSASVKGKIIARSVTIAGSLDGSILAQRVELMPGADVRGHLRTPGITLADGARFQGTVDPERSEAALQVARFREKRA